MGKARQGTEGEKSNFGFLCLGPSAPQLPWGGSGNKTKDAVFEFECGLGSGGQGFASRRRELLGFGRVMQQQEVELGRRKGKTFRLSTKKRKTKPTHTVHCAGVLNPLRAKRRRGRGIKEN